MVVVARIAHLDIAIETSLTNKLAFVVKTGIAVATQAKLEVFAFFGALLFRKVHEGNMSGLGVLGFKHGFFSRSNRKWCSPE